jgi:hypothetical protein
LLSKASTVQTCAVAIAGEITIKARSKTIFETDDNRGC